MHAVKFPENIAVTLWKSFELVSNHNCMHPATSTTTEVQFQPAQALGMLLTEANVICHQATVMVWLQCSIDILCRARRESQMSSVLTMQLLRQLSRNSPLKHSLSIRWVSMAMSSRQRTADFQLMFSPHMHANFTQCSATKHITVSGRSFGSQTAQTANNQAPMRSEKANFSDHIFSQVNSVPTDPKVCQLRVYQRAMRVSLWTQR